MDVRGPTRAAAKRLSYGVALTCVTAAVCAPVAGASTVSNVHPEGTAPTGVTYTDDSTDPTAGTSLALSFDATGSLLFGDPTATAPIAGQSTDPADPTAPVLTNDCFVDASAVNCPAAPVTITMGPGPDKVQLADGLPTVTLDGSTGSDTVAFNGTGTSAKTINLADAKVGTTTLVSIENATGSPATDAITGTATDNVLDAGGGGADNIRGEGGNDTLKAAGSNDAMLYGGPGADKFFGGTSTQILALDGVQDTITCSAGNTDTVTADLGADGIVDQITNPTDCAKVVGTVASKPDSGTVTTETLQPVIVVPAAGSTALTPVLAPGKANFADLTPPSASMRSFTRQRLKTVLSKGVPVRVTCREACGISVALSVDRMTAKRLKLDTRTSPVVVATGSAKRSSAGTSLMRVKFTKPARAAMKKTKRGVVMTTQVLVSDASGNGTLLSRHVTLVR
jgi:hypothetical protein